MKNDARRYWFKRKSYGYGWAPATWEGWLAVAVYAAIVVLALVPFVQSAGSDPIATVRFAAEVLVLTSILVGVAYLTGEPPRWQWGEGDQ